MNVGWLNLDLQCASINFGSELGNSLELPYNIEAKLRQLALI